MRDMKAAAKHDNDEVILQHLTYFYSSLFTIYLSTKKVAQNYTSLCVT